jgi:hypothetical protein
MSLEKSAPPDRETAGPFDESEVSGVRPYVDLGAIKIIPREGLNLRLEIEEGSGRVIAVALDYMGSTLQLQAFSSTRSQGLWNEVRTQLHQQLKSQGAQISETSSDLGPELMGSVPAMVNGTQSMQPARFIGVDGPRWFLRGVIAGPAATDPEKGAKMVELYRDVVVVRGQLPLPPAELLPLKVPDQASDNIPNNT